MTRCTGIIAEYNPLHNGHVYHIERTKSITGGAPVIVAMSGWFVQRGGRDFDVMAISTSFHLAGDAFAISVAGPLPRVRKEQGAIVEALIESRDSIQALVESPAALRAIESHSTDVPA